MGAAGRGGVGARAAVSGGGGGGGCGWKCDNAVSEACSGAAAPFDPQRKNRLFHGGTGLRNGTWIQSSSNLLASGNLGAFV